MSELMPGRIKFATVCALDPTRLLATEVQVRRLREMRASGELWEAIAAWARSIGGSDLFERQELESRYAVAIPQGGKAIFTYQFMQEVAACLIRSPQSGTPLHDTAHDVGQQNGADLTGLRVRISREGVVSLRCDFDLPAGQNAATVIDNLVGLAQAPRSSLLSLAIDELPAELLTLLGLHHVSLTDAPVVQYGLTAIETFHGTGANQPTLPEILSSPELGGIINQSPWYKHYGQKHGDLVRTRERGYREDELYVVDRVSTVIVSDRFWRSGDTLPAYREDLLLLIEHYASRLACLRGLGYALKNDSADGGRLETLRRVLDTRRTLDALEDSLSLTELISQGFARRLGAAIGDEIGLPDAREVAFRRCSASLDNLALRDSVDAALESRQQGERSNMLQLVAILIAVAALLISILLGVLAIMQ